MPAVRPQTLSRLKVFGPEKMQRALVLGQSGFDEVIFVQILDEIDFATHVEWDVTGDFLDTAGHAALTFAAGTMAGTLVQINADQVANTLNSKEYVFTYTVTVNTAIAPANSVVATLTGIPAAGQDIPLSAGAHSIFFQSADAADAADFLITAVDDQNGTTTAGDVDLDDFSLTRVCDAGVNPDVEEWVAIRPIDVDATISAVSVVGDDLTSMTLAVLESDSVLRGRFSRVFCTNGAILAYRL